MPCDQVRNISVEWTEHTDITALKKALEEQGYKVRVLGEGRDTMLHFEGRFALTGNYNARTGQMTYDQRMQFNEAAVKKSYSKAITVQQAESLGWQVEYDQQDTNKIRLRRSRY